MLKTGINYNINTKWKNIFHFLFFFYIFVLLYFIFFGFNRIHAGAVRTEYFFNFIPSGIPLWIPSLHTFGDIPLFMLWFFNFSNLVAFIPIGICIPLLYGWNFQKCILIFIAVISSLEMLQMLTYLGSFDVDDIIINTLGVIIGFIAFQKSGKHVGTLKHIGLLFFYLLLQIILLYGVIFLIK